MVTFVPTAGVKVSDKVTFTVGQLQNVDSLNVTVGGLVIDYEIWNLIWPSLTDMAAKDFSARAGHGREVDEQRRRADVDVQDAPRT